MSCLQYHAPAKVNLNLHITGRRADGYHTLDSFMVFTKWGDTITVQPSENPTLDITGSLGHLLSGDLQSTKDDSPNLVIKALYAMATATSQSPNIAITLNKEIPSGAGLGGGSSNAAATMLALNELWGYPLTPNQLNDIGLTLGAELPVCLARAPSRVQGIGDVITPIQNCPSFSIVIAWPDTPLSTADVFKQYSASHPIFDASLNGQTVHNLGQSKNGLQETAMHLTENIAPLINLLEQSDGCQLSRMTGSGAACFGIFNTIEQARIAARQFKNAIATQTMA